MTPYVISLIVASAVSLIILLFAAAIIREIYFRRLNLASLLSEPVDKDGDGEPKASLSRFQFLIFTFVIAGLYLVLSIEAGTLIDVPNGALLLLGISGGSYLVAKATGAKTPTPDPGDTQTSSVHETINATVTKPAGKEKPAGKDAGKDKE